jgi:hypothetical protein
VHSSRGSPCASRPGSAFSPSSPGSFTVGWAPLDYLRLDTVLICGYAGFTLDHRRDRSGAAGRVLARRRPAVLALGATVGFLS